MRAHAPGISRPSRSSAAASGHRRDEQPLVAAAAPRSGNRWRRQTRLHAGHRRALTSSHAPTSTHSSATAAHGHPSSASPRPDAQRATDPVRRAHPTHRGPPASVRASPDDHGRPQRPASAGPSARSAVAWFPGHVRREPTPRAERSGTAPCQLRSRSGCHTHAKAHASSMMSLLARTARATFRSSTSL